MCICSVASKQSVQLEGSFLSGSLHSVGDPQLAAVSSYYQIFRSFGVSMIGAYAADVSRGRPLTRTLGIIQGSLTCCIVTSKYPPWLTIPS